MRLKASPLLLRTARAQLVAFSLSAIVYYAGAEQSLTAFSATLLLASASMQSIAFLLSYNRLAYERKRARKELLNCLYKILFYKAKGGSYLRALRESAEGVEDQALREKVESTGKIHLMGGELQKSTDLDVAAIAGGERLVGEEIRRQKLAEDSRQAEVEESSQRYATFNMFISTILPSFLVFAFIGNTVLSQGGFGVLLFSCVMLLLIPLLYSLGSAVMWRRLFA